MVAFLGQQKLTYCCPPAEGRFKPAAFQPTIAPFARRRGAENGATLAVATVTQEWVSGQGWLVDRPNGLTAFVDEGESQIWMVLPSGRKGSPPSGQPLSLWCIPSSHSI